MIGDHHVANCLAAAAVGLVFGGELTAIARGLEAIERVPNRLDRVECGQPFQVYIDCADTPHRLAVVLRSLRQVTRGRVICVASSDDAADPDERPLVGRAVERGADIGILTSSPVGNHAPLQVIHGLLDGYNRPAGAHILPGRTRAILRALGQARAGDCVLIAGSDRRGLTDCGQQEKPGDVSIARDWLSHAHASPATSIGLM